MVPAEVVVGIAVVVGTAVVVGGEADVEKTKLIEN